MSGVLQRTAEQDKVETIIKSYFAQDLSSFVNAMPGNVSAMEDTISKQLEVSANIAHWAKACQPTGTCPLSLTVERWYYLNV